jgi:hypothetical protein
MGRKIRKKDQSKSIWETIHKADDIHHLYEMYEQLHPKPAFLKGPALGATSLAAASAGVAIVAIGTSAVTLPAAAGAAAVGALILGIRQAFRLWD